MRPSLWILCLFFVGLFSTPRARAQENAVSIYAEVFGDENIPESDGESAENGDFLIDASHDGPPVADGVDEDTYWTFKHWKWSDTGNSFNGNFADLAPLQVVTLTLGLSTRGGAAGGEFDRLEVGGSVTLRGTLIVDTVNGYVPGVGTEFEIISATGVSGTFDDVQFAGSVVGELIYGAQTVVFRVSGFVAVEEAPDVPGEFRLEQNYPNPFNPSTLIRFHLPDASQVRLVIFDLLGREVALVLDDKLAAGAHEVPFDAGGLSSGAYVYGSKPRIVSSAARCYS